MNGLEILLIGLTAFLGTLTMLANIYVVKKLGHGNLMYFATFFLVIIIMFSIAGLIHSIHLLTGLETIAGINIAYLQYTIYGVVYVCAFGMLHFMGKTFGFMD